MITHHYQHRVRYRECDPMGIVYHTHYLDYFEAARTEALRTLGLTYNELEQDGIILPVRHVEVDYHQPARYDDLLRVTTIFPEIPSLRVPIDYEIHRKGDSDRLTTGHVELCFFSTTRKRPIRPPDEITAAFEREWQRPNA